MSCIQKSFAVRAASVAVLAATMWVPVGCGSGTSSPVGPPIAVAITGAGQVRLSGSAQFAATVSNTTNLAVTWEVNGVVGGALSIGTISATGLYTAPVVLPSPNSVTITAVSQADGKASDSATETLLNLVPVLTSGIAAQTGTGGVVSLDVLGTYFVSGVQLQVGGVAVTTQFVSANEVQATFTPAAGVTAVSVTAINPTSGSAVSNAVNVSIPQVTVTVTGAAQTRLGATTQFTATVVNSPNTAVTWQVNGVTGGSTAAGTISASGLFTAPINLPATNTVTITAVSQAMPSASGTLQESVWNPAPTVVSGTATPTGSTGDLLLDIKGTNFVIGAQILAGGVAQTTQFVSATEVQAIFTPAVGATAVTVAVVNPNPGSATSNTLSVAFPAITVTVTGTAQTRVGLTTQFAATVTGTSNSAVTWQVNGVTGGSAATGTISATGLYTAPAVLPSANPVTISAVSQQLSTVSGSLQEAVWNAVPTVTSGTAIPTGNTGALLLDVRGTNFVTGAQIQAGGVLLTAQLISTTELQATFIPAAGATTVTVAVVNPNPGSATSNTLSIVFPTITVSVTGSAQTRLGLTTQFAATVTGSSNAAVTWQVNGVTGGSTATGTISATGLFTAPTTLPEANSVTITALSQQLSTASGSLQENIWNPVPTVVSGTAMPTGGSGALLLDVKGTGFVAGAQIQAGITPLTTQFISATELQATYSPAVGMDSVTVAVVNPNPGLATSNTLTIAFPTITVTVTGAAQTRVGQTTQFTTTVTGTSNTTVTWQVNGVTGGSPSSGAISSTGIYTAPTTLPSPNIVTISAISQESGAAMGSLQETVLNLVPTLVTVVPTLTNTAGTIFLDVTGTNFAGGSQIQVGGTNLNTTLLSSTEMTANYQPQTGATSIVVAAATPNDGSTLSNALNVTLPTIYAYTGSLPADEVASPYFTVSAAGIPVHTYQSQAHSVNFAQFKSAFTGQYYYPDAPYNGSFSIMSFASVQLNGRSQVAITFPAGFPTTGPITSSSQVKILPTGAIDPSTITVSNNTIVFTVSQTGSPVQLTVEVDSDYLNSLHLFINPFDVVPTGGTNMQPGYITQATIQSVPSPFKFGPGEYWINGNLDFRTDSDIYLADGAIIKWVTPFYPQLNTGPMITLGGNPAAPHVNMFMHGSGILDGQATQQYAANNGQGCGYGTELMTANNLTLTATNKAGIDGIILRNSCVFNLPISEVIGYPTNHFTVNNVKILGFEGNTDGIDLFTDQYIDVTHSFFRTADDEVVVYQIGTTSAYPTTNITVTNNIMWNELAHALVVGETDNAAGYSYGISDVLFDHNTIIHDTGKAFLIGEFNGSPGTIKNVTFSNITIEETKSAIGIYENPTYGATNNAGIVGPMTFSNINITGAQTVNTVNTYVVPIPNIQFLIQLPYGNPYVGNGTTTGAMPAALQGPIVFSNVVANGKPVTSYHLSPGYIDASGVAVPEHVIAEGVLLRNSTYGSFTYEPGQVSGDMLPSTCNSVLCTQIP